MVSVTLLDIALLALLDFDLQFLQKGTNPSL